MIRSRRPQSPNHVLASVSARAYARIAGHMEQVEVTYGDVLYQPELAIAHVYFPLDCLISLLVPIDDQRATEVGMVGNEGMLGVPLLLGASTSTVRAVVQGTGTALRMSTPHFLRQIKAEAPLRSALLRYAHGLMCQYAQTAACNRFHLINARLARWLLMHSDRLQATNFYLTQEFLSQMIGVRRESVNEAAREMEELGLIRYSRGNVNIRDRARLEGVACSCYSNINRIQEINGNF